MFECSKNVERVRWKMKEKEVYLEDGTIYRQFTSEMC